MSKLPVGIQAYGLRNLLEETLEQFEAIMQNSRTWAMTE